MSVSFEFSDLVRLYALQMAYASKYSTVEEIRSVIDQAPKLEDKVNAIAISSIQTYGKKLFNMRANDCKLHYPTVQLPINSWEDSYKIYTMCMQIISVARKMESSELLEEIEELQLTLAPQLEALRERQVCEEQEEILKQEALRHQSEMEEPADNDCFCDQKRRFCLIS